MKRLVAILLLVGWSAPASADLIAYWNFNSYNGNGNPTTVAADSGTGTLSFSSGLDNAQVNNPATGSTLNAQFADPAGLSLSVRNATLVSSPPPVIVSNNGQYIDLAFSTTGYEDLILSYATRGDDPGFGANQWSYSLNGGSFTNFGAAVDPATTYGVVTEDFSALAALDNIASVVLRYTFGGGNSGVGNVNRINELDNIQLNATAIAASVPEPGTLTLAGLGAVGMVLAAVRRRRQHTAA